jgi:hypothetical protein
MVCGAVYKPLASIVPSPLPVAEDVEFGPKVGWPQVTAWLLVEGLTLALNCTVLGALDVLTGTKAGATGDDVTVTTSGCWPPPPPPPPLPGACAMQPASGSKMDAVMTQETAANKIFRTGPSEEHGFIENAGRRREVYSLSLWIVTSDVIHQT